MIETREGILKELSRVFANPCIELYPELIKQAEQQYDYLLAKLKKFDENSENSIQ